MNIKEAEKATGVSSRNIRFYEQKGLLKPSRNRENDYREYSAGDIQRLQLIRALRMVDMPLEQIREVLDGKVELHKAAIMQKEKLEEQIKKLKTVIRFCEELSEAEPENVSEVLMRMDEPENRKFLSKKWMTDFAEILKKVCAILVFLLVVLFLAFYRYGSIAGPSWYPYALLHPAFLLLIISEELFSNPVILLELVFWPLAYWVFTLFPVKGEQVRWRRYLIRPMVALLIVFSLSNYAIQMNDSWEDQIWDSHVKAYTQEVSEFVDEADEVVLFGHNEHQYSPYAQEPRLECGCGAYHHAILIDYDTMRIAVLLQNSIDDFYVFKLEQGALTTENTNLQVNVMLPGSQTRLRTYYPDESSNHRTCAIELILSDGSVYSTTQTPDHHWENGYLGLRGITEEWLFCIGDPHPIIH